MMSASTSFSSSSASSSSSDLASSLPSISVVPPTPPLERSESNSPSSPEPSLRAAALSPPPSSSSTTQRRRLHSWSRIKRPLKKAPLSSSVEGFRLAKTKSESEPEPEVLYQSEGSTHLCFSPDGEWFQGNIDPPHHCVFKVSGIRRPRKTSLSFSSIDTPMTSLPDHLLPRVRRSSGGSVGTTSSSSTCLSSSCKWTFDVSSSFGDAGHKDNDFSQLIDQDITAHYDDHDNCSNSLKCSHSDNCSHSTLDIIEHERDVEEDIYDVTVADLETGLNYKVTGVHVSRINQLGCCKITSDRLSFSAKRAFRGDAANRILLKEMGPSFVDQDLIVYEGDICFSYRDTPCSPPINDVTNSQWCL